MKRKILFLISNLETGGVSKSLTSLMNVIDRERYDVTLMIISPVGPFMELLPEDLNIISNPVCSNLTGKLSGVTRLLKSAHPILAIGSLLRLMLSASGNRALAGRLIAKMMPALEEEYDTIVDFNGQQQLYYMVDKLKARKKVTFFHSDYAKWPYYYNADKIYYPKVDYIFTISDKCVESLKKYFPSQSDKIKKMENISSLELITKMSNSLPEGMPKNESKILLTVGHVCENKGILWAIEAADILNKAGIDFKWYFLGSIDNLGRYEALIKERNLEQKIVFLGIKTNPYPYLKDADIIVHPSKFEGRSIALDEAKLLCKPVVVTNFSTVGDQFQDRHNASICEMNPESIANAIKELLDDNKLRKQYIETLAKERHDNSSEIEKLYEIFDK
ncbi:glycosyltransferase [bacterium]|nr:glycosyltransferase [bacterium]